MGLLWQQFRSQLVKNWQLKMRLPVRFAAELLIPALLMLALAGIKTTSDPENNGAATYDNRSMAVPTFDDLATLPSISDPFNPSSAWYVQFLSLFIAHGASNIAFVCDVGDVQDTGELGDGCAELRFAVLPETTGNAATAAAAADFQAFLETRYPVLANQSRFDLAGNELGDNAALDAYVSGESYGDAAHPRVGLAVVFQSAAPNWSYYIRVNKTASYDDGPPKENVPQTLSGAITTDNLERGVTDFTEQYMISGFLTAQQEVDSFILSSALSADAGAPVNVTLRVNAFAMPTAAYAVDPFWAASGGVFAIFIVLSLLYPVAMLIQQLVTPKETKIRELMFLMGLRPSIFALSWLVFYLIFYFVLAVILTGIAKINLFELSDTSVILVYFLLFLWASIAFCFFIGTLLLVSRGEGAPFYDVSIGWQHIWKGELKCEVKGGK